MASKPNILLGSKPHNPYEPWIRAADSIAIVLCNLGVFVAWLYTLRYAWTLFLTPLFNTASPSVLRLAAIVIMVNMLKSGLISVSRYDEVNNRIRNQPSKWRHYHYKLWRIQLLNCGLVTALLALFWVLNRFG